MQEPLISFLWVALCVWERTCVGARLQTHGHLCVQARGWHQMSSSAISPPCFFRQGLLSEPGAYQLSRQVGQKAARLRPSPSLQCWYYGIVPEPWALDVWAGNQNRELPFIPSSNSASPLFISKIRHKTTMLSNVGSNAMKVTVGSTSSRLSRSST